LMRAHRIRNVIKAGGKRFTDMPRRFRSPSTARA
jgi:hypothetical protein